MCESLLVGRDKPKDQSTKKMKISIGPADPRSKKAAAKMVKELEQIERIKAWAKAKKPSPMPEWAIEDAITTAKKQIKRGISKPFHSIYQDWPEARAAYINQF